MEITRLHVDTGTSSPAPFVGTSSRYYLHILDGGGQKSSKVDPEYRVAFASLMGIPLAVTLMRVPSVPRTLGVV